MGKASREHPVMFTNLADIHDPQARSLHGISQTGMDDILLRCALDFC